MRCRKLRGETAPFEAGRYATHGERKRVSVVAFAISSTEPASGVSGANDCAHARCGYYRRRFPTLGEAAVAERQALDIRRAAEWLKSRHPGIEVVTYFAHPHEGTTAFEPVL